MSERLKQVYIAEGNFLVIQCEGGGVGETFDPGMQSDEVARLLRDMAERLERTVVERAQRERSV